MNSSHIAVRDVIMVVVEGNTVPCEVMEITEPPEGVSGSVLIRLLDLGASRVFFRTAESLESCQRFNGQIVTFVGYSDYLKHNEPDITIRFLPGTGQRPTKTKVIVHQKPLGAAFEEGIAEALKGKSEAEIQRVIAALTNVYNGGKKE